MTPTPSTSDVRKVIHDVRLAMHLPADDPERLRAIAAKEATVAAIEEGAP